jgi:hypothetical protein
MKRTWKLAIIAGIVLTITGLLATKMNPDSGWKMGTSGLDASEVADSCDSVRADLHDTAQVLRAEMPDSAAVIAGDTATVLRGNIGDSIHQPQWITKIQIDTTASNVPFDGAYHVTTAVVDSAYATKGYVDAHGVENDVYVWAYRATSDQAIATAAWTKIQFNAENMDLGNDFDPTTNYRFTAPDSGFYAISARANIQDDGGADIAGGSSIAIYRNDSMMVQGTALVGYITSDITNTNYGPMVSAVIYCPASATIQIYAYQTFDTGGGLIKINDEETWVTIRKVN